MSVMFFNASLTESRILDSLIKGSSADRSAVLRSVGDPTHPSIDRPRLRMLLAEALSLEFSPRQGDSGDNQAFNDTRSWLLCALARLGDDDTEVATLVRRHLDPAQEPDAWVRFWTLEGLVSAEVSDLEELAHQILNRESALAIRKLAAAILAAKGHPQSLQELEDGLNESETETQKATLQALRVVSIKSVVKSVCDIVDAGKYSDSTYLAILVLAKVQGKRQVEMAARALAGFVSRNRRYPMWETMQTNALRALGELKVASTAPVLIAELAGNPPAVAAEAARSLEKVLGTRNATARIVKEACGADHDQRRAFAGAFRSMSLDTVVETLEAEMESESGEQRDMAHSFLTKILGPEKVQGRQKGSTTMDKYDSALGEPEAKIQELFATSFHEARSDTRLATFMGVVVFFLGISLVALSAWLILTQGSNFNAWTGVGVTGGIGVAGVVFGIMMARPRRQVQETVEHLMYLKVVFLAYMRQLSQADHAYTRRLQEDEPMVPQEVDEFSKMVGTAMHVAVRHLTLNGSNGVAKPVN
jgi:hypothetical protein